MGYDQGECATCYMHGAGNMPSDREDVICGTCLHSVIGAGSGRVHMNIEETMKYTEAGAQCEFCDRITTMHATVTLCQEHFEDGVRVARGLVDL